MQLSCFTLLLFLISIHSRLSSAERSHADTCGLSCVYLVSTATFMDYNATVAAEDDYYGSLCTSILFSESFALCVNQYCRNPSHTYDAISHEYCGSLGMALFDDLRFHEAVVAGELDAVSFASLNLSDPMTAPFEVDQDTFTLWYRTINEFYTQLDLGITYGGALLAYFGVFIALAILRNGIVFFMMSLFQSRNTFKARPNKLTRLFQRFVVYPATFSVSHLNRPTFCGITFTLPTRAQTWIVLGYIFLALGLSLSCYVDVSFDENVWWPGDETSQLQRYIADRSGIMAISQIPFVFLFAGRNNILLWLTGWSFQTFNVYHKWTSRVMWSLALVHGATYTATSIRSHYLASDFADTYWHWGVVAITVGAFTIFLGIHNFRKVAYEVFLVIHISLVAIFLAALWWHLNTLGWMQYLYCSIAVWAFDRLARLLRVIYFNAGWSSHSSAEISVVDGHADALLLIKVSAVRKAVASPGQYFFLHIGTIAPWSAHPFTVLEQDSNGDYILVARVQKGLTQKLYHRAIASSLKAESMVSHQPTVDVPRCVVRAGIDGLYGKSAPVQLYDTVLLIAGGVGITGCFSYLRHVSQHHSRTTRHIKLVWVVRQRSNTSWLRPRLEETLKSPLDDLAMDIEIYVTSDGGSIEVGLNNVNYNATSRPKTSSDSDRRDEKNKHNVNIDLQPKEQRIQPATSTSQVHPDEEVITTHFGRPDMTQVVRETVEIAPSSIAILLCGPASMADDVRCHVHHNIERARGRMDYFEEALEW